MTYWLNQDSRTFLARGYLNEGQTAENRIFEIGLAAQRILNREGFAAKFTRYVLDGFISLSSPIWANFGTDRGLPISCNNSYIADTVASILSKTAEIGMMSKQGAGTSAFLGDIRPRGAPIRAGGKADGPVHYAELIDLTTNLISQGSVRRGACAVYLPVEHPDINDFLEMREENHAIQHLSMGVCISDAWMEAMTAGDAEKRGVWSRIIKKRFETGYPYIFFTDNVNNHAPAVYLDKGMKIHSSNLCSEIALASSEEESFVCNLASLNLLHYDEWFHTDVVETLVYFLDAVMSEYIEKTRDIPLMRAAHNFAVNQRALGIGTLGWHSYLQSNMIPFESPRARFLNEGIHCLIAERTLKASRKMAQEYGEPPLLEGYGQRHVTLMAIAPTTSSSFILGQVSPSIEPLDSNYFTKDLQKGVFTYRNPYLTQLLAVKGRNDDETWRSILLHGGSVQQLRFLSDDEKAVFKTFVEIDQTEIVRQAAERQRYIDQAQSLNLKFHHDTPAKVVSDILISGWKQGIKTFYYQRSTNPAQELARANLLAEAECTACEA